MTLLQCTNVVSVELSHYWPGGIPACIKFQPELEIPEDRLKEECRGWIHFVSQNWVPREAAGDAADYDGYETGQRRDLMVKWAGAEQSFRDWHQDQAPAVDPNERSCIPKTPHETMSNSHSLPSYSLIVLPKVDQTNPSNRVQWIKQLLLLNRFDGHYANFFNDCNHHLILKGDSIDGDGQPTRLPASKDEVIRWMFLENADFGDICMTRRGEAVYTALGHYFILDQSNLDEGSMSVMEFGNNGALKEEYRFRPFNVDGIMVTLYERSFEELDDSPYTMGPSSRCRRHVDMSGSVLSMLESVRTLWPGCRWTPRIAEDVEHYAPGYLDLEAEGREAEYDEEPLIEAAFEEI